MTTGTRRFHGLDWPIPTELTAPEMSEDNEIEYCDPIITRSILSHNPHNTLQWRHTERDGVSNPQPHDCLLNRLLRRRSKKTSNLNVTGLCAGNSPVTGEFPAQRTSSVENVSIWWRHHEMQPVSPGRIRVSVVWGVQRLLCATSCYVGPCYDDT